MLQQMYFTLKFLLDTFVDDEKGAELAEYGLVLALVAVAAIVALGVLGGGISDTLNNVGDTISGAGS